jgi:hypothetical protein
MNPRLTSALLVSALLRKIESGGGTGAVLARGDETAGALLLVFSDRGAVVAMRERGLRADGMAGWIGTGPGDPADAEALAAYLERRRAVDPDLWIVELEGLKIDQIHTLLDGI